MYMLDLARGVRALEAFCWDISSLVYFCVIFQMLKSSLISYQLGVMYWRAYRSIMFSLVNYGLKLHMVHTC